jgi:hypothetical protein
MLNVPRPTCVARFAFKHRLLRATTMDQPQCFVVPCISLRQATHKTTPSRLTPHELAGVGLHRIGGQKDRGQHGTHGQLKVLV